MGHAGQFGTYYAQLIDRFYHALEWRYNDIQGRAGHEREQEILAKLLDVILADQVGHDLHLQNLEQALGIFQKNRHDSFTPNKYKQILSLLEIDEDKTKGYSPHLFGNVNFEAHFST